MDGNAGHIREKKMNDTHTKRTMTTTSRTVKKTQKDLDFEKDRSRGVERNAFSWNDVVWEMCHQLGDQEASLYLAGMADILQDPFFISDPIPFEWVVITRAEAKFPHVFGHTWVSPHPEVWQKLRFYQVWRPDKPMVEVFGEDEVRAALNENETRAVLRENETQAANAADVVGEKNNPSKMKSI